MEQNPDDAPLLANAFAIAKLLNPTFNPFFRVSQGAK